MIPILAAIDLPAWASLPIGVFAVYILWKLGERYVDGQNRLAMDRQRTAAKGSEKVVESLTEIVLTLRAVREEIRDHQRHAEARHEATLTALASKSKAG